MHPASCDGFNGIPGAGCSTLTLRPTSSSWRPRSRYMWRESPTSRRPPTQRGALRPLAGDFAFELFAIGIVGVGLIGVPVLAGSAAYAFAEAMVWKEGLERTPQDARGFYGVISLSVAHPVLADQPHEGAVLECRDQRRRRRPADGRDSSPCLEVVRHGPIYLWPADPRPGIDCNARDGNRRRLDVRARVASEAREPDSFFGASSRSASEPSPLDALERYVSDAACTTARQDVSCQAASSAFPRAGRAAQ